VEKRRPQVGFEEVIFEERRPQVQFEEIQIQSNLISKPEREVIVEHHDTVVVPQQTEIIETEVPSTVQVCE
jgi:hypothetical protein